MRGRTTRILIVAAAVVLLHLPAHWAPWSATPLRDALPEDGPVFVRNDVLAERDGESVVGAARRAAADPAAAWDGAGDTVGAAHWRPVAATLLVAERAAPWAVTPEGAVRGAAIVSLLLHLLVSLGAMRLATSLGGDARAALVGGLLAAASPAALAAAAWPARQSAVLATALAVAGSLLAVRGGGVRLFAAGCVLALAGLSHELAFGWVLAVPLLRRAATGGKTNLASAWPCAVAPFVAFAVRHAVLSGFAAAATAATAAAAAAAPATALRGPNALDGAAGAVAAAMSFLVPVRSHFADGPFVYSFAAHAIAIVLIAAVATALARRGAQPAAGAALAALAALTPLLAVGAAGAAPYQDAYLYVVLPLAAAAAGLFFADVSARGGATAMSGVAAAALLLGGSVAATVARAPSFRTRAALIALARAETPRSLVVRAWDLLGRLGGAPAALATTAPDVRALARDATGDALARVRGDAVAAATLSRLFTDYTAAIRASSLPLTDAAYDAADDAGVAATELRPNAPRAWANLAALRGKTGAVRGALDAISHAVELSPDDMGLIAQGAELGLAIGEARRAADAMERAIDTMRNDPRHPELTPELLMLYARTLAADGALRVPDPSSDKGLRYRYDLAADVLVAVKDMPSQRGPTSPAAKLLYDVYVRYGDMLASIDRPAMALLAYTRAYNLTGNDPNQEAAIHGAWLQQRLAAEEAKAAAHFAAAAKDRPDEIGTALLELYVALCRQGRPRWKEADDVFAKLEAAVGGVPPELRLQRAVHRYAALEDAENQAAAEAELRQVLKEKPNLHRAEYELARVLEWQGTVERLADARNLYEKSAREGVLEDWALDADARAQMLSDYLRTLAR